jgi:CBS domain-containing protein
MAQTPDTTTATPDQTAQSGAGRRPEAAANQTMAAQSAAKTSIEARDRHDGETMQQVGNGIGEPIRRSGANGAATQLPSRAGTETTRRGVDGLTEGQQALMADMAEYFETLGQQMAHAMQESTADLRRFIVLPRGAGENLKDLRDGISDVVSGVIHSNIRVTRELLQMGSPGAAFELQRRFMRDYIDALLQGSRAIIRATRQTTDQALQPLQECIAQHRSGGNGRRPVVSDVMSSGVRLVTPEDTVQQATRMMRDEDIDLLPVGENDYLIGIVTDRDITSRVVAEGKDPQRTKVREVMSTEPRYVFEDEDLRQVADNMAQQHIRRLPVVNRNKRLVGVVSIGDLERGDRPGRFISQAMRDAIRRGGAKEIRGPAE